MRAGTKVLFSAICLLAALGAGYGNAQEAEAPDAGGFNTQKLVRIDAATLAKMIQEKKEHKRSFALVDTRNEADYQKGSIPGAVNITIRRKFRFVAEKILNKNEETVCYGYSRGDVAAVNAVIFLMNRGYGRVMFFEEGIAGWQGRVGDNQDNAKGV